MLWRGMDVILSLFFFLLIHKNKHASVILSWKLVHSISDLVHFITFNFSFCGRGEYFSTLDFI